MQNTKTFRLFISSTFNDFRREREVLQTEVFPHIKEYCAKKGYVFQPIDLRWGINEEAQLDQKTLELCLDEVRSCKAYPYPNFLLMLGDRYGWVPLPYAIESREFEEIVTHVADDGKKLLLEWYIEDLNQLPVSYILKERSAEYTDFTKWGEIEENIRTIFQNTVDKTSLAEEQKRKYILSATEAEIEEGIIPYINPTTYQKKLLEDNPELEKVDTENIFGFFRDVDATSKKSDKFMGDDTHKAQSLKHRVKDALIDNNILESNTTQVDEDSLDETYLVDFKERVVSFLEAKVDAQIDKEQHFTPLEIELQAQEYFAKQKRQNFVGQEDVLEGIENYINNDETEPLILYGTSGRGKSSIMAKAIEKAQENSSHKILYRFIGATPHAGTSKDILTSLFEELGIDIQNEEEKLPKNDGFAPVQNQETFEQFSYRVYDQLMELEEDVVIFIDAVDQLGNSDQFLWLSNKLPTNVKIIISALDDEKYQEDIQYFKTLKIKSNNLLNVPAFNSPMRLLHSLLKEENRTIQKYQEKYFLQQYDDASSPLYVVVAAQEMKHWRSDDGVEGEKAVEGKKIQDLSATQQAIIEEFISNLYTFYHHDKELVHRVLGYIYASRDGLSENEILQLLSVDTEFVEQVAPDTWHENKSGGLPIVIWARLYTQLKPFLSVKEQDGEELLYFFHREFTKVLSKEINKENQHKALTKALKKYIFKNQNNPFDDNRWGKIFIYTMETGQIESNIFDFISNDIDNERWIEKFVHYMNNTTLKYNTENKESKADMFASLVFRLASFLYIKDKNFWLNVFVIAHVNWGLLYATNKNIKEAIKLLTRALVLMNNFTSKNKPSNFDELYRTVFLQCASLSTENNQFDIAIDMFESILSKFNIIEKDNYTIKELEYYSNTLMYLGTAYMNKKKFEKAFRLQKEGLLLCKKLNMHTQSLEIKIDYIHALRQISLTKRKLEDRPQESIIYLEEALTLSEEVYNKDKHLEHVYYVRSLIDLVNIYIAYAIPNKHEEMYKKALHLCEKYFQNNPYKHARDYVDILLLLPIVYGEQTDKKLFIENLLKSEQIIKKYYDIKDLNNDKEHESIIIQLLIYYNNVDNRAKIIEYYKKISLHQNAKIPLENEDKVLFFYKMSNTFKELSDIKNETLVLEKNKEYIKSLSNNLKYKEFYDDVLYRLIENYHHLENWEKAILCEEELARRWSE